MSNVKGVFERKSSKRAPKMAIFGAKRGEKLNFWFCDPPKGTSLRGTASFDVFCVKIRAGVLAVDDLKNPAPSKKRTNSREITHAQKRNPLSDLDEILQGGRYLRLNHVGKFWWRSVKGFRGGKGSNFGFSH